jgi:hypothetical protein
VFTGRIGISARRPSHPSNGTGLGRLLKPMPVTLQLSNQPPSLPRDRCEHSGHRRPVVADVIVAALFTVPPPIISTPVALPEITFFASQVTPPRKSSRPLALLWKVPNSRFLECRARNGGCRDARTIEYQTVERDPGPL